MNCAEIEILICDYVDGTLDAAQKADVERHFTECPACAVLARDSAAAVAFMERAADVEPPPELITRILFDAPWSKEKSHSKWNVWVRAILSPIYQPKFAMGLAFTMITLSILWQTRMPRQLQASDLQPARVWAGLEDRADRVWQRTVKYYENLKFVYQIQTMLREFQQQNEEQQPANSRKNPVEKADERKLPVKSGPAAGPEAAPTNATGGSH